MQYAAIAQILGSFGQTIGRNIKWLFVIGGVLLLYWWLKPYWFRIFGQVPDDSPYQKGGGDVTAAFASNSSNKIQQIRKGIHDDAWFGSDIRCNSLGEIMSYNDNELRLIHNEYKNRYGITLYSDLNNIVGDGCSNLFSTELTILLKEKLSKLGTV
jgi:hypothetical protein